jgi:hypothetical protein
MKALKKIITVLTLSTLGFAFTSSASPIITSWDFIVDSAFTDATYTAGTGTPTETDPNILFGAPTNLAWGNQVDQSNIDISSGSSGNVTGMGLASGVQVQTSLFVHNNITIPGGSSVLDTAILSTLLQLTPAGVAPPVPNLDDALAFDILFSETPNVPGMCGGVLCENDIFIVSLPEGVVFDEGTGTLNQQFNILEHTYNTELTLVPTEVGSGLTILHDDLCAIVGAENGCIGFTTFEAQSNEFQVLMTITSVPEPSTILLLSLAMFGIVASMRSKRI